MVSPSRTTRTYAIPSPFPSILWLHACPRSLNTSSYIHTHVHIYRVVAGLDAEYQDGTLSVKAQVTNHRPSSRRASFKLEALLYEDSETGPLTGKATVNTSTTEAVVDVELSIPVKTPRKWTAETPNLYTLVLALSVPEKPGAIVQAEGCRVGFRYVLYVIGERVDGTIVGVFVVCVCRRCYWIVEKRQEC